MIRFRCPYCSKEIKIGNEAAGRRGKCHGCGATIEVPRTTSTSDDDVLAFLGGDPRVESPPPAPPFAAITQAEPVPTPNVIESQALTIRGRAGRSVVVDGAHVKIVRRKSIVAATRERTLPIAQTTSVEVKKPGAMWVGYIQFSIAGGASRDSAFTLTGGAFDAVQDENSVAFADQPSYGIALKMKTHIENFHETPALPSGSHFSAADEILKLKNLMEQGIISPSEFEVKKRQLLGL